MQAGDREYHSVIPADYTQLPYPLLYYFEVHQAGGSTIYPGFISDFEPALLRREGQPAEGLIAPENHSSRNSSISRVFPNVRQQRAPVAQPRRPPPRS